VQPEVALLLSGLRPAATLPPPPYLVLLKRVQRKLVTPFFKALRRQARRFNLAAVSLKESLSSERLHSACSFAAQRDFRDRSRPLLLFF